MKRILLLGLLATTAFGLTACEKKPEAPKTGSLTHHLKLVGADGRHYGHVELDPVGGGRLYDAQGRTVGIVVPAQEQ